MLKECRPTANTCIVTAATSDSVAVIDVTVKTRPVVRGGVVSATNMDTDWAAVSPDCNYGVHTAYGGLRR